MGTIETCVLSDAKQSEIYLLRKLHILSSHTPIHTFRADPLLVRALLVRQIEFWTRGTTTHEGPTVVYGRSYDTFKLR